MLTLTLNIHEGTHYHYKAWFCLGFFQLKVSVSSPLLLVGGLALGFYKVLVVKSCFINKDDMKPQL